jgi:ATP-dependent RNA helicase RhlE
MTTFKDLGLAEPLLKPSSRKATTTPTPIQAQAIPTLLTGRDLLGIAQTGTGKTAAFALPILHRLAANRKPAPRRGCRCLVLSPTRELASQIADSFKTYGRHLGMTVAVVYGGVKYGPQIKAMAGGLDILVATPGRLLDHLGEKMLDLSATEVFVLDEADQMLDLGFVKPIRQVASRLPKDRQNLFFSATMPGEIGKLAGELLNNPAKVSVTPQATTVEKISQQVLFVEAGRKRALLSELLSDEAWSRTLVFTRTKRGADRVAAYLETAGIEAAAIHGDKSQGQRERALAAFKAGDVRCLVATDIAARGIDVDAVSHVVNYELPNVPEAYVHRIGRTARAGASGIAVSLVADDERNLLKDIQKLTRQTIPAFDRRNDRALGALDAAMQAASPTIKPMPPRPGGGRSEGRGGGAQAQRRPAPAPRNGSYDPLAAERGAAPAKPKARPASPARAAVARWPALRLSARRMTARS